MAELVDAQVSGTCGQYGRGSSSLLQGTIPKKPLGMVKRTCFIFCQWFIMSKTDLSSLLLQWFDKNGRDLPWRFKGGEHSNPYIILVSEFMLQQTTVKTVIPYFSRFMERFPTIEALANAPLEDVYDCWQGLGYYSRARSLHATAQTIAFEYGSIFPQTRSEILKLKGIGNYTASSFLALAFNLPETVIDGNVMRIISRLYHLIQPIDKILSQIQEKATALTSPKRPADYASAIMDLGATICTQKNPQCLICPWQKHCQSQGCADLENIPQRKQIAKKEKHGIVYLLHNKNGHYLIRKRTEKGLLSGLYEFPWTDDENTPLLKNATDTGLSINHIFTHINLTLKIYTLEIEQTSVTGQFVPPTELSAYAFSTLMKKAWQKYQQKIRQ